MKHKKLLPLNLQFFAEEGEGNDPVEQTTEFNVDELNEDQLAAIKEKFGFKDDKDVDSIVKTKKSRWQKELEQERDEAARLAKLSEEERQKELLNKAKQKLAKEKEEFRQEQLFVEKGKQLQAIGISSDLAGRIKGSTAEEIMEDVKVFKKAWDDALKQAVDQALVGSIDQPLGGGTTIHDSNPFAKETLNLTEQGRLLREDPEKAKALQALANK
ncbi:hypothetical protein D931_02828 [Enterococcus faecium 13.SD.W.09]|nr:hypothetical protein D931_02828 [Enterococcus faecium 13.SD.W.09]